MLNMHGRDFPPFLGIFKFHTNPLAPSPPFNSLIKPLKKIKINSQQPLKTSFRITISPTLKFLLETNHLSCKVARNYFCHPASLQN